MVSTEEGCTNENAKSNKLSSTAGDLHTQCGTTCHNGYTEEGDDVPTRTSNDFCEQYRRILNRQVC